jgi:dsDNA-binding SOS-regulon protein
MPGVFDRMPEKLTQMQHLLSKDMLHLRGKVGEECSVWLANHEVVMSDVSHRNPRAYDRREEQTTAEGIADMCRSPPPSD